MSIEGLLSDNGRLITGKLMDIAMERQKIIANNIANAETPGFIRQDVNFQQKLADIVKNGDLGGLKNLKLELVEDHKHMAKIDGNNIVLPNEMNEMMQNSVLFNLLSRAHSTRMNIIKSAIK